MSAAPFTLHAPSDAQLACIAKMCDERCLIGPEVVASKTEASFIIGQLSRGTYDPDDYCYPWEVPFR